MLEPYFSVNWLDYIYNISSVLVGYTGALQGDKYLNFFYVFTIYHVFFFVSVNVHLIYIADTYTAGIRTWKKVYLQLE